MHRPLAKETYYITNAFTSPESSEGGGQEEMELAPTSQRAMAMVDHTAYMGGETHIAIKCIAEEMSYMADYVLNDDGECEEVRYDPVPIGKTERIIYINL